MLTLYSFAIKNIQRKPVRTGILVFAIALFVSALVFSLSFVIRVSQSIRMTSERLGADLIVVPTGARGAAEEVLLENHIKSFYMDRGLMERVMSINGVDALTDQTYLVTITGLCCSVPETMIVSFDQDTDFIIQPWLKEKAKRRLKPGEAIVGSESAFNINLGLVPVDSTLFGNRFTMLGTLDKTGTGLDTAIFIGRENMDNIIRNGKANIKPDQISVIFVKVAAGIDPRKVAADIEDTIIEVDTMARKDIGKSIIATLRDVSHSQRALEGGRHYEGPWGQGIPYCPAFCRRSPGDRVLRRFARGAVRDRVHHGAGQ
jgi:putative ABC transport system permease protein